MKYDTFKRALDKATAQIEAYDKRIISQSNGKPNDKRN